MKLFDIIKHLEFKPSIDFIASRLNKQIPKIVSFKPDLEFIVVNAFNMDWKDKIFYAFPLLICVPTMFTAKKYGRTKHLA